MGTGGAGTQHVPYYTDEQIADRCAELSSLFDDIKGYYKRRLPSVKVELDEARLFQAVTAYFHDVARHKWWHYRREPDPAAERLNGSKKAAFLSYWLNKVAPGYVVRGAPPSQEVDPDTHLP